MCGISGFLQPGSGGDAAQWHTVLESMAASLRHRGPDAGGVWLDMKAGVGLAHRRLAIIDPSAAGAQPMWSASGRYCIVFNGEIYNFRELAAELATTGAAFRGHADTEVILVAVETWGLERTLQRLRGMFAFALWDAIGRRLHLARDRIGEKPLYYGRCGRAVLFGSELKALRQHPAWSGEICRGSLTQLLRYGYIPEPRSIHQGIHKLPPGTWLSLSADRLPSGEALAPGGEQGPTRYWSVRAAAEAGLADPWSGSPEEAVEALEEQLQTIIGQQMVADVPLGAFLSGGIDSSTVVALMQAQSARPVQTFTIGFGESAFNEAEYAKAVARHLGTDHAELYVSPQDALSVIPRLPQIYDEPFADPSQIPMLLVSQMARRRVTVALSGDGGDELFAGYNRYLWTDKVWSRRRATPPLLRATAAAALSAVPAPRLDRLFGLLQRLLPLAVLRQPNLGGKLHKLAAALRADSATELYRMLMSYWQEPGLLVPGVAEPRDDIRLDNMLLGAKSLIDDLMYWDLLGYLPGDNLVKVDRAAMSVGLETRLPLLDQRLIEFAWRLPAHLKLRDGQGKWLLRQVAYRHIPQELLERPKMGFSPPIGSWLRGPLREWGEELLAPQRLAEQGLLEPQAIRQCWHAHQVGHRDAALPLWSVLMFQAWYDEQQQRTSPVLAPLAASSERQPAFAASAAALPSG
jgi:asparagine synthase (glutamine-hydrolysing)